MKAVIAHTAWILCALLLGCAPARTRVYADYNPETVSELQSYRTYDLLPPPEDDFRADDITEERILHSVESTLTKKSFQKTSVTPDFLVGYFVTTQAKITGSSGSSYGIGFGGGGTAIGFGFGGSGGRVYEEGTLVIDIVDRQSQKLVWRGTITAPSKPGTDDPEKRAEGIRRAVERILERFPPGK